jgi:hypothetical protein
MKLNVGVGALETLPASKVAPICVIELGDPNFWRYHTLGGAVFVMALSLLCVRDNRGYRNSPHCSLCSRYSLDASASLQTEC